MWICRLEPRLFIPLVYFRPDTTLDACAVVHLRHVTFKFTAVLSFTLYPPLVNGMENYPFSLGHLS